MNHKINLRRSDPKNDRKKSSLIKNCSKRLFIYFIEFSLFLLRYVFVHSLFFLKYVFGHFLMPEQTYDYRKEKSSNFSSLWGLPPFMKYIAISILERIVEIYLIFKEVPQINIQKMNKIGT